MNAVKLACMLVASLSMLSIACQHSPKKRIKPKQSDLFPSITAALPKVYVKNLESTQLPRCRGSRAIEEIQYPIKSGDGRKVSKNQDKHRLKFFSNKPLGRYVFDETITVYAANHCALGVQLHKIEEGESGGVFSIEASLVFEGVE